MPANVENEEAYAAVFDATFYAEHNPDLKAMFGEDLSAYYYHYISTGKAEG